jgi:nitrite reductase/ring-hydroxylating ferredoxin subunit
LSPDTVRHRVTSSVADHLIDLSDGDHVCGAQATLAKADGGTMTTKRSVMVGSAADVTPGELAAFEVEGIRIAVANANGRFFAIDDTCTHEQCSLAAEGTLEGTIVTCGCHGAQFDVMTGAVLAPPAPEPVKAYPLHVEDGNLVVEV